MTIDADTAALVQAEIKRTGLSFKEVLNTALRKALGRRSTPVKVSPLFHEQFPAELDSFNRLGETWDDEDTLRELSS